MNAWMGSQFTVDNGRTRVTLGSREQRVTLTVSAVPTTRLTQAFLKPEEARRLAAELVVAAENLEEGD